MAASEMYDFVSTVTADNDVTLSTPIPQRVLVEKGEFNQVIHLGDDGSEERVGFSTVPVFYVTLEWSVLNESDAGTIMEFYFNPAKANGTIGSFKWSHPFDGHTYVVRFASDLSKTKSVSARYKIPTVEFKVLGRIADS